MEERKVQYFIIMKMAVDRGHLSVEILSSEMNITHETDGADPVFCIAITHLQKQRLQALSMYSDENRFASVQKKMCKTSSATGMTLLPRRERG